MEFDALLDFTIACPSKCLPNHNTTPTPHTTREAKAIAMAPTLLPSEQADLEHAYLARQTTLSQHIARLEQELQQLAPPSSTTSTTTPAREPSYESVQAQVAFRRELGGLQNALARARGRVRRLGAGTGTQEQQRGQQPHHHHHRGGGGGGGGEGAAATAEQEASRKIEVDLAALQDGLALARLAHRREFEALRWQEGVLTKEVEDAMNAETPSTSSNSKSKSSSTIITKKKKKAPQSQARARAMELQADIDALDEEILAHGGLTDGWSVEEHAKFLSLWRAFRGRPGHRREGGEEEEEEEEGEEEEEELEEEEDPVAEVKGNLLLLDRAARVLWARSEGELMRHVVWYVEYRHRTHARAVLVKQKTEAEEEAGREEEEAGLHLDEVTRRRWTVAEWRRRRQAQEEEEEEARKRQIWEGLQRKAAQERRRAARTKEQLVKHREEKEKEERRRAVERARIKEEMEEEAEYQRFIHGGEGGREDGTDNPKILKLVLERRARLSLKHAEERRGRAWARRSTRQAEERARRQRTVLEEVAWEEALLGDGDDVMRRGGGGAGRSLPRFVYRDVGRLNQPTEASSRRAYDDEELDAKDTARLFCLAHARPLPPGF